MDNTELMGSLEAAKLLGISRATLNRRVHDGLIHPVTRIPGTTGAYLFSRLEIEKIDREPTGELHADNPDRYRSEGAA